MTTRVNVQPEILTWAISRAGFELPEFTEKNPKVQQWIDEEKQPTVKQLEIFSKKVYVPFGYLFLQEPPEVSLPIPYFRSNGQNGNTVGVNVYDTILLLQQRQDWLKDYLSDNEFENLPFVGRFKDSFNVEAIVADIRSTLGLDEHWASGYRTWEEAQAALVETIEDKGIIMVFNGVVENNGHRPISVDECRGFVLVDEIAPFMFVNNADWKSAQMFTIIHELAHIWTGHSAGFDFRNLLPANDPIEILCDKVAAEFLVPRIALEEKWSGQSNFKSLARHFKVSEIVIARRLLDTGKITRPAFFKFYQEYRNREFIKSENRSSGGDFWATARKRVSRTFATHIKNAVSSGQLLYRDASKLTSMKGDTFSKFLTKEL
jgi:Zn-dependent peptidase ImmA (M78 family)